MCYKIYVATVPTACGIETLSNVFIASILFGSLQQYLPLAVLKRFAQIIKFHFKYLLVATVLTACGMRRRVRGSRGTK